MKRSALETVDLLRDATGTGAAQGAGAERKSPELDCSITKRFDFGP